jgi:anaerobic selenocysteine-containing dehydrogenase
MNERDILDRGLEAGQTVTVTSHFDDGERTLEGLTIVRYDIPAGCCAAYFPEANPLIPLASTARRSNTPTSKCVEVSLAAVV